MNRTLPLALAVAGLVACIPCYALDVDMDPVPRFPLRKGDTQVFLIHLSNASKACEGAVRFAPLPEGIEAEPAGEDFQLSPGQSKLLVFTVKCTAWGAPAIVRPTVTAGDEPVNFPDRLKAEIVRDQGQLDKKPLNDDGLLAYFSCGDASDEEYTHFDQSVGYNRFWEEGIWYHAGGVKGRAVFGMNGMPYPRHHWSKIAYDPLNNLYYKRGTICFWMRKSRRLEEIPYTARFKGDPAETWKIGATAMRGHEGEGLAGYIWSPQTILTRWHLKQPRPWKPFKSGSDCFLSLRRYKAVPGVTEGFLEACYQAMRGKVYHVQAPYPWTEDWRHVALTWDIEQRRLEIYLDGKLASGKVMCNGKPDTDEAWYGAPWNVMTRCNAAMSIVAASAEGGRSATDRDEYCTYNRALPAEEIGRNMRAAMGKVVAPEIVPAGGPFREAVTVNVRSLWSNPTHRYTTDGSEPTASSPAWAGPVRLDKTATLKVRSFLDGYTASDVASATFECLGPDRTKPAVVRAVAWAEDPMEALVCFDEPVDPATAEAEANYVVDGAAAKAAKLSPDGQCVLLTLARPLTPGMHKLSVRNVADRSAARNVMEPMADAAMDVPSLPGLIGYWSFDVLPGPEVKDLAPAGIDGLAWDDLHPGITRVAGVKGKAVYLDGKDDLVDLTDYLDPQRLSVNPRSPHNLEAGSFVLWFKADPDCVAWKKVIFCKTYAYEIHVTNGNLMLSMDIKVADGRWHHLALTFANGVKDGMKIYLDGKLALKFTARFLNNTANGVGLGVGGGGYGQPRHFKGALDEVMMFNRQLSAEEVGTLMARTRAPGGA
ncbi:MAG TPA: LamG-like jellyroll fold domain-containing protein [Phycisphaerae bacterium]|nr:LamG-like jellyroll fold domain-containing protein [Phycisphaerae bacterium]